MAYCNCERIVAKTVTRQKKKATAKEQPAADARLQLLCDDGSQLLQQRALGVHLASHSRKSCADARRAAEVARSTLAHAQRAFDAMRIHGHFRGIPVPCHAGVYRFTPERW
jgi:hypothetical protein